MFLKDAMGQCCHIDVALVVGNPLIEITSPEMVKDFGHVIGFVAQTLQSNLQTVSTRATKARSDYLEAIGIAIRIGLCVSII